MNRRMFGKQLATHLYPALRAEGFRGSGATLRRFSGGPLVHVFNVQGSDTGRHCYLNLGVHLMFLSDDERPAEKLLEHHCAFRKRMGKDWSYGSNETECDASARAAVDEWRTQGRTYFAPYMRFPEDFTRLLDAFDPDVAPHRSLIMGRIALALGRRSQASHIAQAALGLVGPVASSFRARLRELLADIARSV
jgi:hypothetical protein